MKKYIFTLLALSLLISCQPKNKNAIIESNKDKSRIDSLLNQWHKDASDANYTAYFDAMDSNSYFIGTDASEHWTKSEFEAFSKPYFDKGKAWTFIPIERNIYFDKTARIAWFDELLDTWMGICRGSGVLEKSDNQWKIKHYVLSVSISNEDIKSVVNIKWAGDSVFLLEYGDR